MINEFNPATNSWKLSYPLTDHLGSMVSITDINASMTSQQRYLPFGGVREDVGSISQTDYGYTGQRNLDDTGLMDYKFRFYSPTLGRFILPDNIVPDATNPQTWNRYSYVINNPIKYNDPTGHCFVALGLDTMACVGILFVATVALTGTAIYLNETPQGRAIRNDAANALSNATESILQMAKGKSKQLFVKPPNFMQTEAEQLKNFCKIFPEDCIAVVVITIATFVECAFGILTDGCYEAYTDGNLMPPTAPSIPSSTPTNTPPTSTPQNCPPYLQYLQCPNGTTAPPTSQPPPTIQPLTPGPNPYRPQPIPI